ncbi:MAG: dUTP diphosphatase [Proteobacteria bacterium]|nr:dUTP diphosphatase [Pseudomonadota bacterium]
MNISFKVKLLTETAKAPEKANEGDLWDLFADNFESPSFKNNEWILEDLEATIYPQSRILVRTGIALELPVRRIIDDWCFFDDSDRLDFELALKNGITVLNAPGTIDNSYRKEIGVILYNAGHESYTIKKGDKIAQMLIRPLYPSSFEIVKDFEDTGRGGYGSTGN